MRSVFGVLLLVLTAYPVVATIHTACYNYVLKTKKCIPGAADNRVRCDPNDPEIQTNMGVAKVFQMTDNHLKVNHKRDDRPLHRRYQVPPDSNTTFAINNGPGICGNYKTNKPGCCLWVGEEQVTGKDAKTAGWLNGAKTSNCKKEIIVTRTNGNGQDKVKCRLVDGCRFYTKDVKIGCFQIALTSRTFQDMKPTKKEIAQGYLENVQWNFDNLDGKKTRNGPV